jgi:FtsH-binding integral membrane protein
MITRSDQQIVEDNMSKEAYVRAVAFFTFIVGALIAFGAWVSYGWPLSLLLVIGTFIAAVVCIFLFQSSADPVVSAIGVGGMSFSLGLMIGPLMSFYGEIVILEAIVTTAIIMVVMSVLGILFPKVFDGIGPFLISGLTLLILAQFAQLIFVILGFEQAVDLPWLAWAGIFIFTMFVAYDWVKALELPYTLDNAIDASGRLILDAVNLLIRLLGIYARKNWDGGDD